MLTFPQLMVTLTIFSFMLTVVNVLPSIVRGFQERSKNMLGRTTREMDKFFVRVKILHILVGSIIGGGVLGIVTGSWILAIAVTLAGVFAPRLMLSAWKSIRSAQFEAQLIDGLILISNALKSGLDIASGIELVATNLKAPISEEFGLVLNAYRLGAPLETALTDMTKRIRSRTLDTTIGAIIIQRETGGNLIKTFDQLVLTIREESKLQKKVTALTAQGRTQVAFLSVFPWLLGIAFYLMSPELMQPALTNPLGQVTLIALLIWEFIGIMVTRKVVTVDV